MKEALRYLNSAKGILKSAPVENGTYGDIKLVREACGTAYLAILVAIDAYLLREGISKKDLPRSVDAYRRTLQKHLVIQDGKLLREFEALYEALHIAGYYRGTMLSKLNPFGEKQGDFPRIFGKFSSSQKPSWCPSGSSFLRKQESRGIAFWSLDSRFHGNDTLRAWIQASLKFLIWTRVMVS